eukprot:NODE_381_length_9671_cov_0.208838.p5 type:complete len:254 gc:universal NODE_381_length_9671_cov_0.208838:8113-7352(-)
MDWSIVDGQLPVSKGISVSIIISSLFVFGLYIDPKSRFGNSLDPAIIKRRGMITLLTCFISTLIVHNCISKLSIRLIGISVPSRDDCIGLIHVTCLFLGTLYSEYTLGTLFNLESLWLSVRALFFAPIFEEYVFRSLVILLWKSSSISNFNIIFFTPLLFGIAHVHHAIFKIHSGYAVKSVLIVTMFQLFYTTLFGWYQSWLYLSNANLFVAIIIHSFCNHLGFPRFIAHFKVPYAIHVYLIGLILFVALFKV